MLVDKTGKQSVRAGCNAGNCNDFGPVDAMGSWLHCAAVKVIVVVEIRVGCSVEIGMDVDQKLRAV